MRTNQYGSPCTGCGGYVLPREGRYEGRKADGSGHLVYHHDCASLPARTVPREIPSPIHVGAMVAALPVSRFDVYGVTWGGRYEKQNVNGLIMVEARRRQRDVANEALYGRVVLVREGTNPRHAHVVAVR